MPEPTNHRAEAEYWIGHAVDAYENAQPVDVVHAKALIGIGHALLALDLGPPRLLDLGGEPLSTEEADAIKARFFSHYKS